MKNDRTGGARITQYRSTELLLQAGTVQMSACRDQMLAEHPDQDGSWDPGVFLLPRGGLQRWQILKKKPHGEEDPF